MGISLVSTSVVKWSEV